MHYKVLKDWGDHKAGEIVNTTDSLSPAEVEILLNNGTLEAHFITPELFDLHPEYAEAGLKVGDAIPEEIATPSGEMVVYVVTQAWLDLNPDSDFKIGDEIEIPKEVADRLAVAPKDESSEEAVQNENSTASAQKELHYAGKLVIADGFRTVGEKEVHHIRLEDGSENDLTDEEYEALIKQ